MLVFLIVLAVVIILLIALSEYFLRHALLMKKHSENMNVPSWYIEEREKSKEFLKSAEDVYILSKDGLRLHAYLKRNTESHKFLLSSHGYTDGAAEHGIFYRFAYENGYSLLIPDVRAHGKSEGKWISMGLWEKDDMLLWIDYIKSIQSDASIALHGVSMGASIVMMASGENPGCVKAAIEDCGYSSLKGEFKTQLKDQFHLPEHPLLDIVSLYSKLRLGFFFGDVSPEKEVKKTDIPMLFIHGDSDTFVPTFMVYDVYNSHKGNDKELWITKDAKHAFSMSMYKDEYNKRCLDFIEKYI